MGLLSSSRSSIIRIGAGIVGIDVGIGERGAIVLSHVSLYKNARLHSLLEGVLLNDSLILVGFRVQEINQEVSPRFEVILSVAT